MVSDDQKDSTCSNIVARRIRKRLTSRSSPDRSSIGSAAFIKSNLSTSCRVCLRFMGTCYYKWHAILLIVAVIGTE